MKKMTRIGLEPARLYVFSSKSNPAEEMDRFAEQIGNLYLASVLMQEVRS